MNKVVKIISGICLGIIVLAGVNFTAKAATEYYVTNNGVYAVDSKYPYAAQFLAPGTVIPAHSTVYVNPYYSRLGSNNGLLSINKEASKPYAYTYTTNTWSTVGYNDGAVMLSNSYIGPGESAMVLPGNANWGYAYPYWNYYNPFYWNTYDYEKACAYAYAYAYAAAAYQVPCYDWSNPWNYDWSYASVQAPTCQVVAMPEISVETTTVVYDVCGMDVAIDMSQVVFN